MKNKKLALVFTLLAVCSLIAVLATGCLPTSKSSASNSSSSSSTSNTAISDLQSRVSSLESRVTNAERNISEMPGETTDISELTLTVEGLSTRISELNNDLNQLQDQLDELTGEDTGASSTSTDPEDAVTVEWTTYTNPTLVAGQSEMSHLIRLKVTNNLDVDITDVAIVISLYRTGTPQYIQVIPEESTLTSSDVTWGVVSGTNARNIVFISGWSSSGSWTGVKELSLSANETKTITLSMLVKFNVPTATWDDSHSYSKNDTILVEDATDNDVYYVYRCTTAGTSGGTEPAWDGNDVTGDGGVDWDCEVELGTILWWIDCYCDDYEVE